MIGGGQVQRQAMRDDGQGLVELRGKRVAHQHSSAEVGQSAAPGHRHTSSSDLPTPHSLSPPLQAKAVKDKPTLIKVSTLIGYGSPNKADSHDVHGAPLGPDETAATRKNLNWPYGEFEVPQDVYDVFRGAIKRGAEEEANWHKACAEYKAKYPKEWAEFEALTSCKVGVWPWWHLDALGCFGSVGPEAQCNMGLNGVGAANSVQGC